MNRFITACGIALICATAAYAADETNAIPIEKIIVTPNRDVEDAARATSEVTIISREDIDQSNAGSVADVLERTAGIHIYNQGNVKSTVVDIRGYGDTASRNVLVLINGRRTNPVDISGPDYLQIPLATVERIEIIRGGASVLYGDNATGGVINIITKQGEGKISSSLFTEFGSYESQKGGAEVSGSKDKVSYYAYSEYSHTDGYRDNSQIVSKDAQARFSYRWTDQVNFGLEGGWHRDDYGLPGGLSGAELETLGRRGTADPNNYANTKDRYVKLSGELIPFDASGEYGKVALEYSHRNRDTFGFLDYGFGFTQGTTRLLSTDGLTAKYSWDHTILGRPFSLIGGGDFYDDQNNIRSTSGDDLTITKRDLGLYGHAELEAIDRVFIDGGVRRENAKYLFDQYNLASFFTREPQITVYSGGVRYEYARGSNVFVKAQKTFRFLSTDEWFSTFSGLNTNLKQQEGMEYQAGIKHNIHDTLELSATPFYIRNKNEIFLDPTLGGGFGDNSNYDRTRRIGVDLGGRLDILKVAALPHLSRFNAFLNYTYEDPEFDAGKFDGKFIPLVPKHQATAGVDVALENGLALNVTGRFIGAQFAINDTANTSSQVKPYAVLDTKLTYTLKNGAEVFFGINNLLDRKYYEYVVKSTSSNNKDFFPAPERNFMGGVKLKF